MPRNPVDPAWGAGHTRERMGSGKSSAPGDTEGAVDEPRAFVVARVGGDTEVLDLVRGEELRVGSGDDCRVRVPDGPPLLCIFGWTGSVATLRDGRSRAPLFVNGKRFEGRGELKPGDEIAAGSAQIALGVASPLTAGGRRAFTHHEFRERLAEETARATRRGDEATVVMVHARSGEGGRISGAALETFRAGDVIATYASDELEFLLPDTSLEMARTVVERVLGAADARATVGYAVAPDDGDDPDQLLRAVRDALADALAGGRGVAPRNAVLTLQDDPVLGDPASQELFEGLKQAAESDDSLLLSGEVSTGKGMLARVLHARGPQPDGPFVAVECATLSDDDDAVRAFGGAEPEPEEEPLAAAARGGTLLLAEVGDLPNDAQQRLLAFLGRERGQLRVVSTTQRALAGLVERGAFGRALYEQIAQQRLHVPALRNRPDDVIPLAQRFALDYGASDPVRLSPGALARLRSYPWPGNVLELRNAMERAVRLAGDGEILAEHLPNEPLPMKASEGRLREHVDSVERDAIIKALADSNHNQTHAAKRLGISRRALIYKMEKYGLKRPPAGSRR